MNILLATALFILLSPGVLLTIFPNGKTIFAGKATVKSVLIHAAIFAVVLFAASQLKLEGFATPAAAKAAATAAADKAAKAAKTAAANAVTATSTYNAWLKATKKMNDKPTPANAKASSDALELTFAAINKSLELAKESVVAANASVTAAKELESVSPTPANKAATVRAVSAASMADKAMTDATNASLRLSNAT